MVAEYTISNKITSYGEKTRGDRIREGNLIDYNDWTSQYFMPFHRG